MEVITQAVEVMQAGDCLSVFPLPPHRCHPNLVSLLVAASVTDQGTLGAGASCLVPGYLASLDLK